MLRRNLRGVLDAVAGVSRDRGAAEDKRVVITRNA